MTQKRQSNFIEFLATKKFKGFTLLELVVVMVVVGILAAVGVPAVLNIRKNAKANATQKELSELKRAIVGDPDFRGYVSDFGGALPADFELAHLTDSSSKVYNPFTQTGWRGPYFSEDVLEDPWGNKYQLGASKTKLVSYGPDGVAGGGDDIEVDIDA